MNWFFSFVTIHSFDRRRDGQTEFSSLDRVCIQCSAVKRQVSTLFTLDYVLDSTHMTTLVGLAQRRWLANMWLVKSLFFFFFIFCAFFALFATRPGKSLTTLVCITHHASGFLSYWSFVVSCTGFVVVGICRRQDPPPQHTQARRLTASRVTNLTVIDTRHQPWVHRDLSGIRTFLPADIPPCLELLFKHTKKKLADLSVEWHTINMNVKVRNSNSSSKLLRYKYIVVTMGVNIRGGMSYTCVSAGQFTWMQGRGKVTWHAPVIGRCHYVTQCTARDRSLIDEFALCDWRVNLNGE